MLQYFINASSIWLLSLVLFDIFLRRESYHSYNRYYLLFTFLLGALFPVRQWQTPSQLLNGTFEKPLAKVMTAKQAIVTAEIPDTPVIHWSQWLLFIYLLGAIIAVIYLVNDILKLIAYYKIGTKTKAEGWTIVSTENEHAPFTFMQFLFINDRKLYDDAEWEMILLHESRHRQQRHFVDLFLLQVARIIFWFHPLVYLYNKRLLLVHEYQADNASCIQPKVYGSFLVEQAMLHVSPSVAHSFNHSQIKSRILMLTRQSTKAAKSKFLVFIPLLLLCILCFSRNSYSQKQKNGWPNVVAFGISDTGTRHHVTYDQALANLRINCKKAEWQVTHYSIMFVPIKKGSDIFGPFTVNGSNLIQGMGLATLQKLKKDKEPKIKIFIDEIKVKRNGIEQAANPQIFTCTLN